MILISAMLFTRKRRASIIAVWPWACDIFRGKWQFLSGRGMQDIYRINQFVALICQHVVLPGPLYKRGGSLGLRHGNTRGQRR
jgi:hypothetical protein